MTSGYFSQHWSHLGNRNLKNSDLHTSQTGSEHRRHLALYPSATKGKCSYLPSQRGHQLVPRWSRSLWWSRNWYPRGRRSAGRSCIRTWSSRLRRGFLSAPILLMDPTEGPLAFDCPPCWRDRGKRRGEGGQRMESFLWLGGGGGRR